MDHNDNRSPLEDIRGVQLVREIRTTVPAPWCQLLSHQPTSIWFICLRRLSEKEMLIQHFKIGLFYKPSNFVYKVGLEIDFLVSVLQGLEKREDYYSQSFTDMSSIMKTRSSEMNSTGHQQSSKFIINFWIPINNVIHLYQSSLMTQSFCLSIFIKAY